MLFSNPPHMFRILSVLELSWGENKRHADARDFHAISFRMQGNSTFVSNNHTVNAPKNSVCFVPEGLTYDHTHINEHLYVVHFKTENKLFKEKIFSFIPNAPQMYESLFKKMFDIWNNKQSGYYYAAASCFFTILQNMQNELTAPQTVCNTDKMNQVLEYIHLNFTDCYLSVSFLAEMFGTSETFFRKTFKSIYGTTPLKYINSLRTEYAIELLRSGYFSVNQVSEKSGFSDPKYFSRVIKNKTSKSPSEINIHKAY